MVNEQPVQFQSKESAALFYADKGFQVFPLHYIKPDGKCSCGKPDCSSPGKHPMTKRGLYDATDIPAQIRKWWKENPNANIGIRTGPESGIFVIDIDLHGDKNGNDSLRNLFELYGDGNSSTDTAVQRTGSGGRHIIYRYPDDQKITNLSTGLVVNGVKYPGIDIRGIGGYIVAAPSNHVSGGIYEYYDKPITDCPAWLLKIITTRSTRTVNIPVNMSFTASEIARITGALLEEWGTDTPESAAGHGHRILIGGFTTIAKRHGINRESILAFMTKFNREHPMSDGEIHPESDLTRIVNDFYDREYLVSSSFPEELKDKLYEIIENRNYIKYEYDNGKTIIFDALRQVFQTSEKYTGKDGSESERVDFVANVDIYLNGVVRDDDYDDPAMKFKVDCIYAGRRLVSDRRTIVTTISDDNSLLGHDRKMISIFFLHYIKENTKNAVEYHADPVYWDTDDIARIIWLDDNHRPVPFPQMNVKDILMTLHDLHNITTHPDAFVQTMVWSMLAPFSLYFRKHRIPVPFKAQVGAREAAKTEMSLLFVADGFNRDMQDTLIGENEIFTQFTVMKLLSSGKLPMVFDDVSNTLLQKREAFFKNIYLGLKAGTRGRADQQVLEYANTRNFILTINTEMDVDAASESRYVIDRFTQEHAKRQNISLYNTLKHKLPGGFLLAIMREIFDGVSMKKIMDSAIAGVRNRSEQNYALLRYFMHQLNGLCVKLGIPPFPITGVTTFADPTNPMEMVCQEIMSAYDKYRDVDDMGRIRGVSPYIPGDMIDVQRLDQVTMIWFKAGAYMRIAERFRGTFTAKKATDFVTNTMPPPNIEVWSDGHKSHRFPGSDYPSKAFCLKYMTPVELETVS